MNSIYIFDYSKNKKLKEEREICFDDVIEAIADDRLLAVVPHHNKEKYPSQDILVVEINKYAYMVPYILDGDQIILKTVYPSRRATMFYLSNREN
jgi:hypothetical protein